MTDLRQLQYFIACVETGSFSEAARILYTTQSSVSKAMKTMEESMGLLLFERMPKGIVPTAQGRKVYRYACRILKEVEALNHISTSGETKWLRVSTNPSSWFATQFVSFYNQNYEKNYHCQVYTSGVRTVMERVRDYKDDVGFIYLMEHQEQGFQYELGRNHMEFVPFHQVDAMLYLGEQHPDYGDSREVPSLSSLRFIQNYQDEFLNDDTWEGEDGSLLSEQMDVSVVTNSDYIMERMLRDGKLANISGNYLPGGERKTDRGIPLNLGGSKVTFGYLKRKREPLDELAQEFVEFLKKQLAGSIGSTAEECRI